MAPEDSHSFVETLDEAPLKQHMKQAPPKNPVPLSKRIPKVALNFTKWRLQQQMVTDLREITDP